MPQPAGAMQTAVQLTFVFEIASMQLTPTFKMGALQLRPFSKIVTMRLAGSAPQPAMNLQVTFEIARIQPAGGTLGSVRLTPSQQQRPTVVGSPSFTVGGLHLVSDFAAAPLQLTPSQQGQATVHVVVPFQIATVEFSPSFEISSIVLNSNSKQVSVQRRWRCRRRRTDFRNLEFAAHWQRRNRNDAAEPDRSRSQARGLIRRARSKSFEHFDESI